MTEKKRGRTPKGTPPKPPKEPGKMGAALRFPPLTGDPPRDRVISPRRALGLSQKELAEKIWVTQRAVAAWEGGYHGISGPALNLLEQLERQAKKRTPA